MSPHTSLHPDTSLHPFSAAERAHHDWLPGFNFNVEEWSATGLTYETLAICRSLALARAAFAAAIADKPASRFTIRNRTRVVQRHPEGDW